MGTNNHTHLITAKQNELDFSHEIGGLNFVVEVTFFAYRYTAWKLF